jgi:hypothetical protein
MRIRATSTDECHYHLVEIDEQGNGFTTSLKDNCFNDVKPHNHKIENYICLNKNKHEHEVEANL